MRIKEIMDVLRCDSASSTEFWFPFFFPSLPCAKWLCTFNWFQFLFYSVPPRANERKSLKDSSRTTTSTTERANSVGFVQRLLNIYDHSLNKSLIYRSCVPTKNDTITFVDLAALAHRHSLAANVIVNWSSSHVVRPLFVGEDSAGNDSAPAGSNKFNWMQIESVAVSVCLHSRKRWTRRANSIPFALLTTCARTRGTKQMEISNAKIALFAFFIQSRMRPKQRDEFTRNGYNTARQPHPDGIDETNERMKKKRINIFSKLW